MRKDNRGRKKGSKNSVPIPSGANHWRAKLWDVYRNGEFLGTYKSNAEVSKVIEKSPTRCWQIANGYQGNYKHPHPIITQDGWCVLKHGEQYGWWLNDK